MERILLKLLNDYGADRFLCTLEEICHEKANSDHTENGDKWRNLATCIYEITSDNRNLPKT